MGRIDYLHDPDAPPANSVVPSVVAFVQNDAGQVLMIQRSDNGRWALPGRGHDVGESISGTVVREVWEETGIRPKSSTCPASTPTLVTSCSTTTARSVSSSAFVSAGGRSAASCVRVARRRRSVGLIQRTCGSWTSTPLCDSVSSTRWTGPGQRALHRLTPDVSDPFKYACSARQDLGFGATNERADQAVSPVAAGNFVDPIHRLRGRAVGRRAHATESWRLGRPVDAQHAEAFREALAHTGLMPQRASGEIAPHLLELLIARQYEETVDELAELPQLFIAV